MQRAPIRLTITMEVLVMKTTVLTSMCAFALSTAAPFAAHAQVAQPNQPPTASSPTSSQPPTGAATGTTDRQGQTGQPLDPAVADHSPTGDPTNQQPADVNRNQSPSSNQSQSPAQTQPANQSSS